MCTLTITRTSSRLWLTMNRDDDPSREEAGPQLWNVDGASFLAPVDLAGKGTWIGVNARGVVACLLNRYDPAPLGRVSRGAIVVEAMRAESAADAISRLNGLDLAKYSPFTCLVVSAAEAARLDWTGLQIGAAKLPQTSAWMMTSSSWNPGSVTAQREALFEACRPDGEAAMDGLTRFHCRRTEEHDAWAPMMLRAASRTKSVTQIELGGIGAAMRYWRRETAIASGLTTPDVTVEIGCPGSSTLGRNLPA